MDERLIGHLRKEGSYKTISGIQKQTSAATLWLLASSSRDCRRFCFRFPDFYIYILFISLPSFRFLSVCSICSIYLYICTVHVSVIVSFCHSHSLTYTQAEVRMMRATRRQTPLGTLAVCKFLWTPKTNRNVRSPRTEERERECARKAGWMLSKCCWSVFFDHFLEALENVLYNCMVHVNIYIYIYIQQLYTHR